MHVRSQNCFLLQIQNNLLRMGISAKLDIEYLLVYESCCYAFCCFAAAPCVAVFVFEEMESVCGGLKMKVGGLHSILGFEENASKGKRLRPLAPLS